MTRWFTVFELRGYRWHVIAGTRSEREAVGVALRRWGIYCRPVCIAPDGVLPDVAFPAAACDVAFRSLAARYEAFTRARRDAA